MEKQVGYLGFLKQGYLGYLSMNTHTNRLKKVVSKQEDIDNKQR